MKRFFGLALFALALARPAYAAEPPVSDRARAHFQAGVNYMLDPDGARYEEAYLEFKAAYADSPSWKILGNLGIAAMKLERDGEAIQAFQHYLEEGKGELAADERAQFERDLQTLRDSVVWITLESAPQGATVTDERTAADGSRIINSYGPLSAQTELGIRPGRHKLTARIAGREEAVWELEAAPGQRQSHRFDFAERVAPPPVTVGTPVVRSEPRAPVSEGRAVPTSVYVGVTATALCAVGAGVFGTLALVNHASYNDANDGTNPTHAGELRDNGKTLNVVTDVFLGATVVAAGVTAALYFTRPTNTSERARVQLVPAVSTAGAGLLAQGRF